ncbi:AbrB family transcriptional regulator [Brevibacillus sp. SYP-B805]|uniref:AbrB family transcriptional regulator n=1 Tax=Brevibacillus sp. SYP-B805 TaxID=1578199 RepID=UPI0013EABB9A|nr:AbrB family transcriptional regulator [Brevibacillus sp. SYP-B805]NGQ95903.1 AbrB family transcriptional regulator [Brevibacillus sp. SYP-B805]
MQSRIFFTLLLACAGGGLFAWVHSPLPWLLGPLVTIVAAVFLGVTGLQAPAWFRKAGLIVVGITLGLRITPQIWQTMSDHLGLMLLATIVTVCFGMLNAWILHKWRNVDLVTSLFSNIPGGLSEMVTIGQNLGGNLQIISIFHSIRVVIIVCVTPYVATLLPHQMTAAAILSGGHLLGAVETVSLLAGGALIALVASRLRIPAPFLLGPLLMAAVLSASVSFAEGPPVLADFLVKGAQVLIGISIGVEFKREDLGKHRPFFLLGLVQSLFLFGMSLSLALLLSYAADMERITSILSTAPGGIAEMSLTALATGADPLLVTAFQLFRVLFIVTVFSFLIRAYVKKAAARVRQLETDHEVS